LKADAKKEMTDDIKAATAIDKKTEDAAKKQDEAMAKNSRGAPKASLIHESEENMGALEEFKQTENTEDQKIKAEKEKKFQDEKNLLEKERKDRQN